MKKRLPTNVRVVKCPKCSKLLPEPTDVPFYICGGCNTYLQAKYYKKENARKPELSDDSSNALPQNNQGGESSDSSPQSIFSAQPSPEPCRDVQDCNLEPPDSVREDSSSNGLCTAETQATVSSHLSSEDGKIDSKNQSVEQFVDGKEASFSDGANSLKGHGNVEEVSAPALDFNEVVKGENFVAEEIGVRSYSSEGAQSNASDKVRSGEGYVADDDLQAGSCKREDIQPNASPTPSAEPAGKKLSNGEVEQESDINVVVNDGSGRNGIEGLEREVSSTDDSHIPESNSSLSLVSVEDQEREEDNVAAVARGSKSKFPASSEDSTVLPHKEISGLPPEDQERVNGKDIQGVNSEIIPMSNEVSLPENQKMHETLTENQEKFVGKVQDDEPSGTKEEICEEKLQTEIISSVEVAGSHEKEKLLTPPTGQNNELKYGDEVVVSDADISSQTVLSSDSHGNRKEAVLQPLEANLTTDKNHSFPPGSNSPVEIKKLNSIDYAEVPMTASKSSDAAGDNSGQKIKGANQKIILNGLQTSAKMLEGAEIVDVKLEVVDFPKGLPRSPTRGSSVYDGSVSSYDGNDDHNLHAHAENREQISEVEDQVEDERQMPDNFASTNYRVKGRFPDNQAMLHSGMGSPEIFEGGRREFRRNKMMPPRPEENFPSRYSVQVTNSEIAYESSVSSNLMHDEFQSHPNSYLPPQSHRDIETRAIRRRHFLGSDTEGRICSDYGCLREGGVPAHPHCGSACETCSTQNYERYQYPGGARSCELHYPYAHVPFYPRRALRSGYQQFHHDPYLPSQPPSEFRWSSQLSPPRSYYGRDLNCVRSWKHLDSYPASPQYADSSDSYSWGYDVSTDEQRQKYEMVDNHRLQIRKKQQTGQRRCRPVAGGAPFATCYECAELLQLPSDFLLFKSRRIHRLKCTCCSAILKFQLEKGDRLVPYIPKARPSPKEESIGNEFNSVGSTLQENNINKSQAAPQRNTSSMNRNQVQYTAQGSTAHPDSSRPQERQSKVTWKNSLSKGKRVMMDSGVGASTSSVGNTPDSHMKVSGEQQPGRSTSPLHRLMGYSSPSHVLYGSRSTYSETP